jgi:acetolactate synthase I/II/III large subunit
MSLTRSGGQVLADQLVLNGADLAFCVPGESYLDLLDALLDRPVRVVTCRHEAAAANAAEAYGKLTGRPGVCMVTRGPGATHAATGVHTAFQDSTPMLLLIGQVPRGHRGREGFQEIDYAAFFGPVAKWVAEVPDAARIPELVQRAYHLAVSGRPGPVVLSLPEDVLAESTDAADATPARRVQAAPSAVQIDALRHHLAAARRPLLIAGGGDWTAEGARALQAFAAASGLPTAVSFRAMDLIDNESPVYCGHVGVNIDPRLAERVREADLILALGPRLGAATTRGYTLLEPPDPAQTLIHAHPDAAELGRVYRPALAITTGMPELAAALVPIDGGAWSDWLASARADYVADREPSGASGGGVDLGAVVRHVNERLGDEAVITVGAGNYTFHVHRYHRFSRTERCSGRPRARWATASRRRWRRRWSIRPDPWSVTRATAASRCRRTSSRPACRRACRCGSSSSRTACSARSASTRSDASRGASPGRHSARPTSPRSPAPMARTATAWSGRPTSRPRSSARSPSTARRWSRS